VDVVFVGSDGDDIDAYVDDISFKLISLTTGPYGENLVQNGDAEAGLCAQDTNTDQFNVPSWNRDADSLIQAISYDATGGTQKKRNSTAKIKHVPTPIIIEDIVQYYWLSNNIGSQYYCIPIYRDQ
ncbi:unnamed protein product, partial [Didymodactylos carnosus]